MEVVVVYNIYLDDKSLIPKSLACHLNSIYTQSRTMQQTRSCIQNGAAMYKLVRLLQQCFSINTHVVQ